MSGWRHGLIGAAVAVGASFALAACGGGSSSSTSSASTGGGSSGATSGGTITMEQGSFPESLDPGFDYTGQGFEVNSAVYTGLLTYRHASGAAGATLVPGLATALPKITDGGTTYTFTLRKGLKFSNGKPVVASDFAYTFERDLKIPWGGSGNFMTPRVKGASAYAAGKAKTISGIQTDDKTGKIVIHLTAPYGMFENVLGLPAMGLIPAGTPMHNEPTSPPPGVGPYMVKHIVVNQSYDVVRNPYWAKMHIPGLPSGHVDAIDVHIGSNLSANALAVLNNTADIFDYNDTVPGSLLAQVRAKAADRFKQAQLGIATQYIFLNSTEKPFSSQLAREAVAVGLNHGAMNRLAYGTLTPACYLLPPAVPGHSTAPCPYGDGSGNMAKARALVRRSGMEGQPVSVWSESSQPEQGWMTYYTQFLNQIGFKAKIKVIDASTYEQTAGELRLHPQTGWFEWIEDFPNPLDFYGVLVDGDAILHTNNLNFGEIDDPHVNAEVARLSKFPTTQLHQHASQWAALDRYVTKKAYVVPFGYPTFPEFASARIDYRSLVLSVVFGWDFTSFALK